MEKYRLSVLAIVFMSAVLAAGCGKLSSSPLVASASEKQTMQEEQENALPSGRSDRGADS